MTEQSRLDLMVLMLNEQHALGRLYTHSKGKVMQQNVYKAQWKITWYNIDETFNITATVQNEKRTCKKSVSDFLHCLPTFLNVCYIITLTTETFLKLFLYIQLCVSSKCLCCVVWWMKSWMYEWSREMCSKGQSLKKGYFFFFKTHPSNHPYIHYLAFLWKWFFMKSSFAIQETINPKEQITS